MTNTNTPAPWPEAFGFLVATFQALNISTDLLPTDRMLVDEAMAYIARQDELRAEEWAEQIKAVGLEPNPILNDLPMVPVDDAQDHATYLLDRMALGED